MQRLARSIAAILFLLAVSSTALMAQFDTGSITGLVKDATGSAVPGANMTLVDASTGINITTRTNEAGVYEFPNVRVGSYKVTAEKAGFSLAAAGGVVVSVSTRTRVDLNLTVGEVTQTVEVTGSTPLIETETSQRGQVVNGVTVTAPAARLRYSLARVPTTSTACAAPSITICWTAWTTTRMAPPTRASLTR